MSRNNARYELRDAGTAGKPSALTIGVFDGVHRGHQHLIHLLIENARREKLATVAVTFHPHPRTVLNPGSMLPYLTSLEERVELLRRLGLDAVLVLTFTRELARLSARDFLSLLREELDMRLLVVGPDFALGRGREGNVDVLRSFGDTMGFHVEVAGVLTNEGEKIGSTATREALAAGNMEQVAGLLGRVFSLKGLVVEGAHRGRAIGYPTANIDLPADRAIPAFGIYVTRAHVHGKVYLACTSVGVRPTFEDNALPTVETYILDFGDDIYGEILQVDFLRRLREERKFASVPELIEAIKDDVQQTRDYALTQVDPTVD